MDNEVVPVRLPEAFRFPLEGTSQGLPERSIQKILLRSRPRWALGLVYGISALYGFCDGFLGCHRRSFLLSSCLILRPHLRGVRLGGGPLSGGTGDLRNTA